MTVPPRGTRARRAGSKPGWQLLTALLVLAILASATLVFTNRVELLRLAVILSLWAAVLAAFVTVVYRRQSEVDQARARDMKHVYDLQLDREIAARREYELSVEAHLRRQMSREARAQAADEVAALRAELTSLRGHLEAIIGVDLGTRPALGSDRVADPLVMPPPPGRVESSRVTVVETVATVESVEQVVEEIVEEVVTVEEVVDIPIIDVPEEPLQPAPPPPPVASPPPPPRPAGPIDYRGSHRRGEAPYGAPPPPRPPRPAGPTPPWRPPEAEPRRGRHWTADNPAATNTPAPPPPPTRDPGAVGGRHWVDPAARPSPAPPAPSAAGPETPTAADEQGAGQHTGGHSVADLMARLRIDAPSSGGGRRRRED